MSVPEKLLLRAQWGTRGESVEQIADRASQMFTFFEGLGGICAEPFWSVARRPVRISGDRVALEKLIRNGYDRDGKIVYTASGSYSSFMQNPYGTIADPRFSFSFRAGSLWGSPANRIFMGFEGGAAQLSGLMLPTPGAVSAAAITLVEEVIRVWEPDAVSLDSTELLDPQRRYPYPTVGYVSWFSDHTLTGELPTTLPVVYRNRFENGTLLSVDLSSGTLTEDGLALVKAITNTNLLAKIPSEQPNRPGAVQTTGE